ncbi:MAG: cytochrome C [Acidobacteriota bacterium]
MVRKRISFSTLLVLSFALVASSIVIEDLFAAAPPLPQDPELARIDLGYRVAPVPLTQHGPAVHNLIGLGSYLVNAGGCNDCHTLQPFVTGHDPFLGQPGVVNPEGYLAGGQHFGPFTSRNLTPEENGLPAGLTFAQFRLVIRTGIDLDHKHPEMGPLLQVMPWPAFKNYSDRDLRAIWEYLRSIPRSGTHD